MHNTTVHLLVEVTKSGLPVSIKNTIFYDSQREKGVLMHYEKIMFVRQVNFQ
jgi:hypothetical protein